MICLVAIDVIIGAIATPLLLNEPDAGNNHSNFKQTLFDKKADIIILGASKANHHYIPDSLSKHFNMSVLNTGVDGDNVVSTLAQFKALVGRHIPKMVIIDLSAGQTAGDFSSLFLSHKCYYDISQAYTSVAEENLDKIERLKLNCNLLKMNEVIPDILQSYVRGNTSTDGFIPMSGTSSALCYMHKTTGAEDAWGRKYSIGSVHEKCLDEIISTCQNNQTLVYVVYSPTLISYTDGVTCEYEQYCNKHHVRFINYEDDTLFVNHTEYFKDYNHLNIDGARVFTSDFIQKIKN